MPITQKEALILPDLMMAHAAQMEELGVLSGQAQDHELRRLVDHHQQIFRRHYDTMRSFLHGPAGGFGGAYQGQQGWAQGPSPMGPANQPFEAMRPDPQAQRLSDRSIAVACLAICKCNAVAMMTAATECATFELRRALANMAEDHLNMAYDLFRYLQARNWYYVPEAPQQVMAQVGGGFQGIGQPAGVPVGAGAGWNT